MSSGLAPPGSSTYSSNTMNIGDGTWDSNSNTFLLPNVQGLNFATMRYNGMGNRFRDLQGYYSLVVAHGTLAAITFLFIVPTAILVPKYYHRNPRLALRVHIGLQVLTVILTTVIFVLGYFAVGPKRPLTNPHHVIGLIIYILILFQATFGWIVKKIEKGKARTYIPVKLMLHQWLGRGIALLAFAQIPIGLTLYGSPPSLFVLYTLWMTFLLVLVFVLVHRNHKRIALAFQHRDGSWVSGSRTEFTDVPYNEKRSSHRLEKAAGAVGLAGALGALRRRYSGRQEYRSEVSDMASTLPPSQAPNQSHMTRFTESDDLSERTKQHTWRNRLLGAGAGLGAATAAKRFFGRGRSQNDEGYVEPGPYARPPLGGAVPASIEQFHNLEEGRPYTSPQTGHGQAGYGPPDHWQEVERREAAQQAAMSGGIPPGSGMNRTGMDSRLDDEYTDLSPEKPQRFNRWGLPTLAAVGGLGGLFKRRRNQKEDAHVDAQRQSEEESERLFTTPGGRPRYTGDGTPMRGNASTGYGDFPPSPTRTRPYDQFATQTRMGANQVADEVASSQQPPPPPANIPPPPRSSRMPPPPPVHSSPRSTAHGSPSDVHRRRAGAGPSVQDFGTQSSMHDPQSPISGGPASSVLAPPRPPYAQGYGRRTNSNSPRSQGAASPPVSVNVKMSNDGRHVTLRRLSQEEANRQRGRPGGGQGGSPGFRPGPSDIAEDDRSRMQQRDQTPRARPATSAGQQMSELHLPQADAGMSTSALEPPQTSSPYDTGTGTDVTDFDSNRRRRRAERARAEAARNARRAGGTGHVEFT